MLFVCYYYTWNDLCSAVELNDKRILKICALLCCTFFAHLRCMLWFTFSRSNVAFWSSAIFPRQSGRDQRNLCRKFVSQKVFKKLWIRDNVSIRTSAEICKPIEKSTNRNLEFASVSTPPRDIHEKTQSLKRKKNAVIKLKSKWSFRHMCTMP